MQSDIGAFFHQAAVSGSRQELEELVANISRQLEAAGAYGVTEMAQEINRRNEKKYTPLHTAIFFRFSESRFMTFYFFPILCVLDSPDHNLHPTET